ncbi:MAG: type 4a pilus biogenesis protein PilO [Tepidisphaera sp.]|nr:type 4a pilus biogenesis protein PilO [Tepidisphaera sp.]
MSKLGPRALLVLVVVVGLPVTSYFAFFRPANIKMQTEKEDCDHKEALLEKLQKITERDSDLVKANEDIKRSVKIIEARLPSGKEMDGLVRQVSDLAITSGLNAPTIKSSKPVPAALYMEQPLEMQVTGSFVGFFTYLAQIEKLPRITRIHDLKIEGANKEGEEIKAQFTLSIYFQDESQLASGDSK